MENGLHISRNHIDLKRTDILFEPKTQPVVSSNANFKHAPPPNPVTNVKCTGKANLTEKGVEVRKPNSMYTTHSGHVSEPVRRLITQM